MTLLMGHLMQMFASKLKEASFLIKIFYKKNRHLVFSFASPDHPWQGEPEWPGSLSQVATTHTQKMCKERKMNGIK